MGLLSGLFGGGKPAEKKKGGHGSHWRIFFSENGAIQKTVMNSASKGKHVPTAKWKAGGLKDSTLIVLEHGDSLSIVTVLLQTGPGASKIFSAFPAYFNTPGHSGKITRIEDWANGAEAQVEVKLDSGPSLWFFATDYIKNKSKYIVGANIEPRLAGFAYQLDRVTPGTKEMVTRDGRKLSVEELVAILPLKLSNKAGDVDDYLVWAKVEGESKAEVGDIKATVFDLTVAMSGAKKGEKVTIPVVTNEKTAAKGFSKGEKITGIIWLTGSI